MSQDYISKKAMLVVDIQNDFTGQKARMPVDAGMASQMITNLNTIIDGSKKMQLTVIYIGNEYSKYNIFNIFRNFAAVKGTNGIKMDSRLHITTDYYFSKHKGDAFSNPALNIFLKKLNITALYIGGLYAEACIYATVKGAIEHGYETTVLTDCIATKTEKRRTTMVGRYKKTGAKIQTSKDMEQDYADLL